LVADFSRYQTALGAWSFSEEAPMNSTDSYRKAMQGQMSRATHDGAASIDVNAFELNHSMGGFYGSAVWMDNCCEAINGEMRVGDTIIAKHGSALSLTVRYLLPRPAL
jgi:hypothetical protein